MKPRLNIGYGVVGLMASALTAMWFLGERGGAQLSLAANEPIPVSGSAFIALIVAVIFLNALFVAAETAVDLLRAIHVKHVKEEDRANRERLQDLVDNKQRYATACTLASRIARVIIALAIVLLAASFDLGPNRSGSVEIGHFLMNLVFVAIPVSLVNLVVGELVPKSFASLHPHRTGLRLYRLIRAAAVVFSVPASLLVGVANLVTRTFGGRASFTMPNQAEEEIRTIVESAQESGEIEIDEKKLLNSVFEFTDTVAREIMTPRVDMDAMPIKSDPADLVRVMQESGHSRIPLYEETDDQIVGIVHAKDILMRMVGDDPISIRDIMRPALFVPEGKNLHELLREMRQGRSQMAVVQDEFGGTAGIVTIEDIVEELVGDIVDEYDTEEPEPVESDTGGFVAEGKTHLDDVNEEIGSSFESEEFDTVGGYVFGLFGRQPKPGESIQSEGYRFLVLETDGRRILKLRIEPIESPSFLEEVGE
ncbi:hemolysin family protein [Fimbriimonas ginsengisoli]|uniref:Magnesium and cobalt efflux protein CorC n=1 Tax=Fimbriimonas ginsengisoli Gsoil 348 TaxID=661478 RepID=A0A068NPS1_FIMGI|nr:hemolysin family protein [Fimbriimonas ginsengisoli]AIE83559.1 Magnesium and cobalt efflux protein CorC [Fimbriimonas ginsengisoli Gsoil 348]